MAAAPTTSTVRYRIFVALALAVAFGAMALAVMRTDTDDDPPVAISGRPDVVEHLVPRSGAEVLRQAELGIDLAGGYEGRLVINGLEIPEDQLRLVPEQNQVFFTPGEGKAIEELPAGPNCVNAIVWKTAVGRGSADQSFRWCFDVT